MIFLSKKKVQNGSLKKKKKSITCELEGKNRKQEMQKQYRTNVMRTENS